MLYTIGELIDDILPYVGNIETSLVNGIPFIRTNIISSNLITQSYLYIVQVDDYTYTACDDPEDSNGNRYFPCGTISRPLIKEKEMIRSWFCDRKVKVPPSLRSVSCVNRVEFLKYFYKLLNEYKVISVKDDLIKTPLIDLGFNNSKIKDQIADSFIRNGMKRNSDSNDLINIVNLQKKTFRLDTLKGKDRQFIAHKLSDVGLQIIIHNDSIDEIRFERPKCISI